MFTGIIQGIGEIVEIAPMRNEKRFVIQPLFPMDNLENGESISVNGVCLSVEKHDGKRFQTYASAETLGRSNLDELEYGAKVNLERALAVGERLGGHIVSGHIDCVAIVRKIIPAGNSKKIVVSFSDEYAQEIIDKGSVALNGISLTVNKCGPDFLEVNIIPDSFLRTNINSWKIGARINLETDMIGKYVLKALTSHKIMRTRQNTGITASFLAGHGFI